MVVRTVAHAVHDGLAQRRWVGASTGCYQFFSIFQYEIT